MEHTLKHDMCLLCGDIHGCLRDEEEHKGFFDSVDKCGGFENTDIIMRDMNDKNLFISYIC